MSAVAGYPLRPSDPAALGGYQLLRRLGEGGMGCVYLAQADNGRVVALKVIRADLAADPDFRRRFRGEVARVKEVPAFCTAEVLDADPDHETPYLVVEYVDGPTLSEVVQARGPLSQANLHGLAIGVATALTAIHGAGVIHRDLKPGNVLLALGSPKVIDFGIARALDGADASTTSSHLIGTIPYMAPERIDPDRATTTLTPAADIFAWGAVVAFAGLGRPPFGTSSMEAAARILTQPPDLGGLSGRLRELVEQALAKDPAQRPSARDLLDMLVTQAPRERLIEAGNRQAVVNVPVVSPDTTKIGPAPLPVTVPPPPRRRLVRVLAALVVLLLGVAGVAYFGDYLLWTATPTPTLSAVDATSSATPSSSPSPTASSAASPSPAGTVVLTDALASPGPYWRDETSEPSQVVCKLADGSLTVSKRSAGTYRCPGYMDPFTNAFVSVDVTLKTPATCAAIWFRFSGIKGYLLTVCRDRYVLYIHDGGAQSQLRTIALPSLLTPGTAIRVGIGMSGDMLSFYRDGQHLSTYQNSTLSAGRIILGIAVPSGETASPFVVAFQNIEIRELRADP